MSQTRYIKLISVFFIALFCNLSSHAINLDSLLKIAGNTKSDTNTVKALHKIARFYSKKNTDSSVYFYNKAQIAAKEINYYRGYFNALNGLSWVYYLKKQYSTSDSICNIVLNDNEASLINKYDCYYNLSYFRISQSKFADALNYLLKAQKIAIDENNPKLMCDIYNNFGNLYNSWAQQEKGKKDKFRESLNYYLKADSVAIKYNVSDARINFLLINLALAFENIEDEVGAERYYRLAFDNLKNSANQTGYALVLANYCGFKLMKFKSNKDRSELITCLEVTETAKKIAVASNFTGIIPGIIYSQASAYFELGEKEKSIQLLNQLLSDSLSLSVSNFKESYELLYRIYESTNDHKNALKYHKLFFQFTDSMNRLTNEEVLNDLEIKYKTDQKEKENQLLQAQNLVSTKTIKEQKTRSYIIITGLILALLFGLFVFRSNKQQQKANLALEENNILIEAQKKETEHQKEIIETQQKEVLDSISYAQRIQKGLLASSTLLNNNLPEHFVFFKPKDIVSGDFYWASPLKNGGFALITADSTGHGVPGAFMSLLNISFLNEAINERGLNNPSEILDHTRTRLIQALAEDGSSEGGKDGMDCTLCCFDFKNLTLRYAAANNSFYIFRNNELLNFEADKMPVGKSPKESVSFSLKEVSLQKDDIVYTLTDGYPDQFGGTKGKKFKYKQLENMLINSASLPLHEQAKLLNQRFAEWKGSLEQVDDVLIIGIKI